MIFVSDPKIILIKKKGWIVKMKKTKNIIWIIALILVIILIGIVAHGYYKNATMEVKNPIATMEVEKPVFCPNLLARVELVRCG